MHTVIKKFEKLLIDNSPAFLTAIGVMGTITTAYLTGRATYKAAEIIYQNEGGFYKPVDTGFALLQERTKLVWTLYIPPVTSGLVTIICIVGANRVGTRRAAAMAAAYSLSERAFTEYREKVVEKIGTNKERAVRDAVAQDQVTKNPNGNLIVVGGGEVLCYESYTGRYFTSNMESLRSAQNDINATLLNDGYASLSDLYDILHIPHTDISDDLGWKHNNLLEMVFSTTMSDDNRPCISVTYRVEPIHNYYKFQ
jgi:hypothetical protein